MIPDTRIAVIGLGLMGGSMARALHVPGVYVLGFDRDGTQLEAAMRDGAVQEALASNLAGIAAADVVVLALPVDATIALLPSLASRIGGARLVMDLGSTKRSIVAAAESAGLGPRFVGAHPLTGGHRTGWGASRASLFDDARVFLCPTSSTTNGSLQLAASLWRELRAGVEVLDATVHDDQMAWRSHLPHLLSCALAVTLREAGVRRSQLGPGGRDVTRLAGGSPAMWLPIVQDNAVAIANAMAACERELRTFREAVLSGDRAAAAAFLQGGADWFDGEPERVLTRGNA